VIVSGTASGHTGLSDVFQTTFKHMKLKTVR